MKLSISLFFIFCFLISPASAFSDDMERYTDTCLEKWDYTLSSNTGDIYTIPDPRSIEGNTVLYAYISTGNAYGATNYVYPVESSSLQYTSFIMAWDCDIHDSFSISVLNSDNISICTFSDMYYDEIPAGTKFEVIKAGSNFNLYLDGDLTQSKVSDSPSTTVGKLQINVHASPYKTRHLCIDDYTTSSIIGCPGTLSEGSEHYTFTWNTQLMRSYQESEFKINLYSLTNPVNAGLIKSWNIPSEDNATTAEHGYVTFNRINILGNNFGLYYLETVRNSETLTGTYFYYSSIANPQGLPEIIFMAGSDVETNILDESNNGGEISGGEITYLYPDINENGVYNISYTILELPYSVSLNLDLLYNTTPINQANITISGLSGQNYNIALNNNNQGSNEGENDFTIYITDFSLSSQIITLTPDYTLPGFWGYVKNEDTQNTLKSATVTISNGTYSKYLYTDTIGMYYITAEIYPGAYNISASKNGFSTSLTFQETATEGATTRKDIFLAPSSGSGVYYAPHDVRFTIKEFWYSNTLPGVSYSVYDSVTEETDKTGYTDSHGSFTVSNMDSCKNYTITLNHQGTNYTKYIEPGLNEYTLILKEGSTIHSYGASWLNLTYSETAGDIMVYYKSSENITEASLTVTAMNGSTIFTGTNTSNTGSFNVDLSAAGEYLILFEIETITGKTASQSWAYSSSQNVDLFPESYPAWLKNTLFGGIVVLFLLSFGKSKNDIACLSVAILTSLGYHFSWHTGSFGFVVLVWIIAAGAAALHYKRTGHLG